MIAVIVINFKSDVRTIDFIKNETVRIGLPHKVIVINNGSTPESDDNLSEALGARIVMPDEHCDGDSDCYIISNLQNSGFAKGNNIGARFAVDCLGAEYLLFSNNDIRFLDDRIVETLVEKLDTCPTAGIVGPRVVGLDGKLQSPEPFMTFWDRHVWMYLCTPFYSKQAKARRFQFDYSEKAKEGFHYKLMGSFFMTRSQDFVHCGMMDEHTFLYCEEPILTERMKRIGLQPYYCPFVSVLHDHGVIISSYFNSSSQKKIQFESECYYYRTYRNTPWYQILIGRFVNQLVRLLK